MFYPTSQLASGRSRKYSGIVVAKPFLGRLGYIDTKMEGSLSKTVALLRLGVWREAVVVT